MPHTIHSHAHTLGTAVLGSCAGAGLALGACLYTGIHELTGTWAPVAYLMILGAVLGALIPLMLAQDDFKRMLRCWWSP
jgi:hypothetical protein